MSEDRDPSGDLERGTAPLSIRLRLGGTARIGPGKIALLEAIAACSQLTEAARVMGMSARRAWLLIDSLNQVFDQALVTRIPVSPGEGEGTRSDAPFAQDDRLQLTSLGEDLVRAYRAVETVTENEVSRQFAAIEARLLRRDPL
ncbi:MAG: winged helix-turn-helix domain-containing protein [Burkholderiaceae bacterium]